MPAEVSRAQIIVRVPPGGPRAELLAQAVLDDRKRRNWRGFCAQHPGAESCRNERGLYAARNLSRRQPPFGADQKGNGAGQRSIAQTFGAPGVKAQAGFRGLLTQPVNQIQRFGDGWDIQSAALLCRADCNATPVPELVFNSRGLLEGTSPYSQFTGGSGSRPARRFSEPHSPCGLLWTVDRARAALPADPATALAVVAHPASPSARFS